MSQYPRLGQVAAIAACNAITALVDATSGYGYFVVEDVNGNVLFRYTLPKPSFGTPEVYEDSIYFDHQGGHQISYVTANIGIVGGYYYASASGVAYKIAFYNSNNTMVCEGLIGLPGSGMPFEVGGTGNLIFTSGDEVEWFPLSITITYG